MMRYFTRFTQTFNEIKILYNKYNKFNKYNIIKSDLIKHDFKNDSLIIYKPNKKINIPFNEQWENKDFIKKDKNYNSK